MMTITTIEAAVAARADQDRAVAALTAAFCSDPVIRWLFPDSRTYFNAFPRLARLMGGDAFVAGTAAIAEDHAGAALWVSPDAHTDDEALIALFHSHIDPRRLDAAFELLTHVGDHHPDEPVWYLPFVGVDPTRQGQGLGSRLVRAGLERAAADGLTAYLEASSSQNRALYECLGFEVVGEIHAADCPPLWPMLHSGGAVR
jgi:ribosomal protein S18 acetylase RimI-like enzyme